MVAKAIACDFPVTQVRHIHGGDHLIMMRESAAQMLNRRFEIKVADSSGDFGGELIAFDTCDIEKSAVDLWQAIDSTTDERFNAWRQ